MRTWLPIGAVAGTLLGGGVAVAQPAVAGPEAPRISVPYSLYRLDNGLTVILHEDNTTPTVSVNVWYHVGSGREKPGRTGFAHLFEHIMFEGSEHVPEGQFDRWLEASGGDNNGSTNNDRTNYWENIPSNALELALFLESDRMGYLLGSMSPQKVDGQRDVVKNERRQSYENRPYGMAFIRMYETLYPDSHPYHWPTIGYMEDLSAAGYEDVVEFFRAYYGPNNASLSIAGDIDPERTLDLVEKWFGGIPAGPPVPPIDPPPAWIDEAREVMLEDQVQLPRVYVCWITPGEYQPGDAELDVAADILAGGKNSRLYKRLVYDLQIAQDVYAGQFLNALTSEFCIVSTARQGHGLDELEAVIEEELERLEAEPPNPREIDRAVNQVEAAFLDRLEQVGGFGGKADALNGYYFATGNPDYFNEDLARYRALEPEDVRAAVRTWLREDGRAFVRVIPAEAPPAEPAPEVSR
jgi:zinc protease